MQRILRFTLAIIGFLAMTLVGHRVRFIRYQHIGPGKYLTLLVLSSQPHRVAVGLTIMQLARLILFLPQLLPRRCCRVAAHYHIRKSLPSILRPSTGLLPLELLSVTHVLPSTLYAVVLRHRTSIAVAHLPL